MIRYTRMGSTIVRLVKVPYGYELQPRKRVPRPVQQFFRERAHLGGFLEADFDPKTRAVSFVPFYEQIQGA